MRPFGYSTGALAKGDFRYGIEAQRFLGGAAIELSALRDHELIPLIGALGELELGSFSYISLHAPSELVFMSEGELVTLLSDVPATWPIIVHPDIIKDYSLWRNLGGRVCLENMDQRKVLGRTVAEMEAIFELLPDASFCFDIGHARQVDPTMGVALGLLQRFRAKLLQVHVSEVDPFGKHVKVGFSAFLGFRRVAKFIPQECPIILEQSIEPAAIRQELDVVLRALQPLDQAAESTEQVSTF